MGDAPPWTLTLTLTLTLAGCARPCPTACGAACLANPNPNPNPNPTVTLTLTLTVTLTRCCLPGAWPLEDGARFTFGCDFRPIGGPERVLTVEYRRAQLVRWGCEDRV